MDVIARSEEGSKDMNCPMRAPVSAYRLKDVAGLENWEVRRSRDEIVGMPYVYSVISMSVENVLI